MRSITPLLALCAIAFFAPRAQAQTPKEEVTFITDRQRLPDEAWQRELRHQDAWQQFLAAHGTWYVEFNEETGKPHRAYGRPVPTSGSNDEERAMNFIATQLGAFGIPADELELQSVAPTRHQRYVHFKQRHLGVEVLFSHFMVKLDQQGRVIAFGGDVQGNINMSLAPLLAPAAAATSAEEGLTGIATTDVSSELAILPVPGFKEMEQHLVYRVTVRTQNAELPGHYECFVDANTGRLLYRRNTVMHGEPPPAGPEADITATVNEENPWVAPTIQPLPNLKVTINGTPYYTDAAGHLSPGLSGSVSATLPLEGLWSKVRTNSVTPTFNTTLNDGPNAVSFDGGANIRERSAYFHVNIIHDHQKALLPAFTGMDFSLPTNVDVSGNCNAFYDGSSINFYAAGNDCQSYAQIGDVVYHEYGHGINDNFYQSQGGSFTNGAMNEGYADVWALSVYEDPILAEGSSLSDPAHYIRRYDIDPKIYPVDIIGEVHADGEIIAGAWWDTYVQLGNDMAHTMMLFADAYPGLQAETPDGNEGVAYRDVLLDVLQADDDDADITNGTPNGNAIVEAFAIHGITLVSNAELVHTPLLEAPASAGITVNAVLNLAFPFSAYVQSVALHYRVNTSATWNAVIMNNTGGNNYSGQIPPQPEGTVVGYYLGVLDIFQQVSAVVPPGATLPDPNIPYFILVGYALQAQDDCDDVNQLGNWHPGMPGDNATTGQWTLDIPIPSYSGGVIVQTDAPFTPGGELCFLTGNAALGDGVGVNDVDGGRTTLQSDPIDMSALVNPTFTFYRWYVNDPPTGANPGADWWQVSISNNGTDWQYVENTRTSDKSWRRFAFRVQDYVTPNATVQIRFVASDSIRPGQYLDGGSLVEAAIDDIGLWVNAGSIGIDEPAMAAFDALYPDPASNAINVELVIGQASDMRWEILDAMGRVVLEERDPTLGSHVTRRLDVSALRAGTYLLRATWDRGAAVQHFTVMR